MIWVCNQQLSSAMYPRELPAGWVMLGNERPAWKWRDRILVTFSVKGHLPTKTHWVHVSASCRDRTPTWTEMARVKACFVGENRTAIQVMPPADQHVNSHPFLLHIWAPVDERDLDLPDFRRVINGQA